MSTALYRRYRPDTFADLIGQDHVTQPLMAGLESGRISHAYLFSGPRGCGKTTSARIMARCLNCAEGPTATPCGKCESCRELATGGAGSLDVVEIDAASHNGVDDARELRERAAFAPIRDRFKIFILDEAHMVTQQGFNALLKVVEEPPPHIKFIFATTEPEKVIGTIRSRTHHYPFRLVAPETMQNYLVTICQKEQIAVADGVLPLVVRAGGGSVRDTLSILDQLIGGSVGGEITLERATALLGFTDTALLDAVVEALVANDGSALFNTIESIINSGQEPRRFVEDLLQRLRDMLLLALSGAAVFPVLETVTPDNAEELLELARNWGAAAIGRAANAANDALTQMRGATSPRLLLELLCARLLLSGHSVSVESSAGSEVHVPALQRVNPEVASSSQARGAEPAPASSADAPTSAAGVREMLARQQADAKAASMQGTPTVTPVEPHPTPAVAPVEPAPQVDTQGPVAPVQHPVQQGEPQATGAVAQAPQPGHVEAAKAEMTASAPAAPVVNMPAVAEPVTNAPAPVEPVTNMSAPVEPQQFTPAQWQQLVEQIRAHSRVAAALLQSSKARPAAQVKNTLIIAVERGDQALALQQPTRLQPIYQAAAAQLGPDVQLIICAENEVARHVGDLKAAPRPVTGAEAPSMAAPQQTAQPAAPTAAQPAAPAAAPAATPVTTTASNSAAPLPGANANTPAAQPATPSVTPPVQIPEVEITPAVGALAQPQPNPNPVAAAPTELGEQWTSGWGPVAQPGSRRARAAATPLAGEATVPSQPAADAVNAIPDSAQNAVAGAQEPVASVPLSVEPNAEVANDPQVATAPIGETTVSENSQMSGEVAPVANEETVSQVAPESDSAAVLAEPEDIAIQPLPESTQPDDYYAQEPPAPNDIDYYTDFDAPAETELASETASATVGAASIAAAMSTQSTGTNGADAEVATSEPAEATFNALHAEPSPDDEDVEFTTTVGEAVIEEFFPGARIIEDQRTEG